MRKCKFEDRLNQILFMGPSVLAYSLFFIIPFILSIYFSMTKWNGVSNDVTWTGLGNFVRIFTEDADFFNSLWFTSKFSLVTIVLTNMLGLVFALILTKALKFRNIYRMVLFLPNILGGLLLGFIWQFIFVVGFPKLGEITNIGLFGLSWLGTENTAFWGLVIVSVWQGIGYVMVIYIAGLMNVPVELMEAAKIDGGNRWQVFRSITIPFIMPSITVCLFWTIACTFKIFDLNFSLTKGGPYKSTESLALNIYNEAFAYNRYGLGTAKALIFFVVIVVITSIQVYTTKKREVEA